MFNDFFGGDIFDWGFGCVFGILVRLIVVGLLGFFFLMLGFCD